MEETAIIFDPQAFAQSIADWMQRMKEAIAPIIQAIAKVYRQIEPLLPRRYRPHKRHTRQQIVLAKRKSLDLSPDGKCCNFRTRKASLAFRLAEQDYYAGRRATFPKRSEFERMPPRRQRKAAKYVNMLVRGLRWNASDQQWINLFSLDEAVQAYHQAMAIPPEMLGELENINR